VHWKTETEPIDVGFAVYPNQSGGLTFTMVMSEIPATGYTASVSGGLSLNVLQ